MRAVLRELLPQRRRSVTFTLRFGGQSREFTVTVGLYDDGRIGEVFITTGPASAPRSPPLPTTQRC